MRSRVTNIFFTKVALSAGSSEYPIIFYGTRSKVEGTQKVPPPNKRYAWRYVLKKSLDNLDPVLAGLPYSVRAPMVSVTDEVIRWANPRIPETN